MEEIIYVDYGIASRIEGKIEMNKYLKDYPALHDMILEHEKNHTDKLFSLKDLIIDLRSASIVNTELIGFMFKHPKSFFQIIPIYYSFKKKAVIYDLNLLLMYLSIIFFISAIIYLSFKLL